VDFKRWEPYYLQILKEFGYDGAKDRKAAKILLLLLELRTQQGQPRAHKVLHKIKNLIENKHVCVFGAGSSVDAAVQKLQAKAGRWCFIAADGATTALVNQNTIPSLIVTDLDGKIDDLLEANRQGAIVILHAHGDNIPALKKWVLRFPGAVLGSTQAEPIGTLYNFGGFTDGDRAVFLAAHFRAAKITLAGFDFTNVGKYSYCSDPATKLRKLAWAAKLIAVAAEHYPRVKFTAIEPEVAKMFM
jgi:hypothetical protein